MSSQIVLREIEKLVPTDRVNKTVVVELGSRIIYKPKRGTTAREILQAKGCKSYIGIDIKPGNGVDLIGDASDLSEYFEDESVDIVVCTDLMEHVRYWHNIVHTMFRILKVGGFILFSSPARGFPYHGYPKDYWRFETFDIHSIFRDWKILYVKHLGGEVFGIIVKKSRRMGIDWWRTKLYSVLTEEREYVDAFIDEDLHDIRRKEWTWNRSRKAKGEKIRPLWELKKIYLKLIGRYES